MRNRVRILSSLLGLCVSFSAVAWEHHPMFTAPVISTMSEVTGAAPVAATSLKSFLTAVESDLVGLLANEEAWAKDNMSAYKPRPDGFAFQATGNPEDVAARFFRAIRVNPNIKTPLYLSPLAGVNVSPRAVLAPPDVCILNDTSHLSVFDFQELAEGDMVAPADILAAASNEPDFGMDIGLFEDNNTDFGKEYGFGVQPFGNPGLDYGSQAPFHMGIYHESWIIYLFASFLNETYPEYRIHLYKSLSEFAFAHGQPYWGWRFMGWGLHYLGDLSMPYHTAALPGYSTFEMLLVNILKMLGWATPQDDAVQLASNRHVALETFQGIVLEKALRNGDTANPAMAALLKSRDIPKYADCVPRHRLAKDTHDLTMSMNSAILHYMPSYYVSDPSVELGDVAERYYLPYMIEAEHGPDGVTEMEENLGEAFAGFAAYGRSYVLAVLGK